MKFKIWIISLSINFRDWEQPVTPNVFIDMNFKEMSRKKDTNGKQVRDKVWEWKRDNWDRVWGREWERESMRERMRQTNRA